MKWKYVSIYLYMFTYAYVYIYLYTRMCKYIYIYIHTYIHTYIYIYIRMCFQIQRWTHSEWILSYDRIETCWYKIEEIACGRWHSDWICQNEPWGEWLRSGHIDQHLGLFMDNVWFTGICLYIYIYVHI